MERKYLRITERCSFYSIMSKKKCINSFRDNLWCPAATVCLTWRSPARRIHLSLLFYEIEYIVRGFWCRRPSESDTIRFVILFVRRNNRIVNGYKLYLIPFTDIPVNSFDAAALNSIEFSYHAWSVLLAYCSSGVVGPVDGNRPMQISIAE